MLRKQAGKSVELLHSANGKYLQHQHCEIAREVYESIHTSGLDRFTYAFIDSSCNELNDVLHDLDHLPESEFKELIKVITGLSEAQNELRLARFLFDLDEIPPLYHLIIRNRAVLRGKRIIHKVLQAWPLYNSSHE
jgi:hypothetical protein